MSNAIAKALEDAAKKVGQAIEDAAKSVVKFFKDTVERIKRAVKDLVGHDEKAAEELTRAAKHTDETPDVPGGGSSKPHTGEGESTHPVSEIPEPNDHPSLGEDPAHGGAYNHGEYETSQRVQSERGVRLERSDDPRVEWVDQHGRTYDAMGPIPSEYFDKSWRKTMLSLDKHVEKADFTPFDVTGLSPEQIARVKDYIKQYGDRVFVVGE